LGKCPLVVHLNFKFKKELSEISKYMRRAYLADERQSFVAVGFGESGNGIGSILDRNAVAVLASGPVHLWAAHRAVQRTPGHLPRTVLLCARCPVVQIMHSSGFWGPKIDILIGENRKMEVVQLQLVFIDITSGNLCLLNNIIHVSKW
jgi:hypothetical protein